MVAKHILPLISLDISIPDLSFGIYNLLSFILNVFGYGSLNDCLSLLDLKLR